MHFKIEKLRMFIALALSLLVLSSCAEKKFREAHDQNIKLTSDFAEAKEDPPELTQDLPDMVFDCKKASFNLIEMPIYSLGNLLSKVYDQNINSTVGPEYKGGLVTIKVRDICLEPLLDELTNLYNIGYEKTFSSYTIYPPEIRSKIFTVDYHNFYRNGSSTISISSTQLSDAAGNTTGGAGTGQNYSKIDTTSKETFWDDLEKTLNTIVLDGVDSGKTDLNPDGSVASRGHISVYRDSGVVIVRSYPRTLKHVEAFLNSIIQKATKQVLIEAKILEVTLNDEYQSGIYWELLKKKFKFSSFFNGDQIGGNHLYDNKQISPDDANMVSSVISGRLNARPDFAGVIQALSVQGKVSVLSSPKIAALNNQRALIKFGDDSYYITGVTTTTLAGNGNSNGSSQQGFSLTPYFSGIALDTTPSIMSNNDVILHIHPIISSVVADTKQITISGQASVVPAAKITTRETDTVVKAQTGDIIVIGGLMQSTVEQDSTGLPAPTNWMSKIFSTVAAKKKSMKKVELVILLKPTISPGWSHSDESFKKYLSGNEAN